MKKIKKIKLKTKLLRLLHLTNKFLAEAETMKKLNAIFPHI